MKYLFLLLITFNVMAGLPPTTSKVSGDSTDVTTFKLQFPNFTGTHTGTTLSLGINGIVGGGTGQSTKTAAFDALSPMTTIGDVIYGGASGTGTRLAAGTTGQFLKSNGSAAPSWASTNNTAVLSLKTGATTLTPNDQVVVWDTSGGVGAVTLPTAVGNTGLTFTIILGTAGNTLTINTTSAQTIGGFASGAITLSSINNEISVISDGANWKIMDSTQGSALSIGYSGSIDNFSVSFAGANPGTASATVCSAGTCAIDQIGNAVSSIGFVLTGNYTMTTSKTYTKLKCQSGGVGTQYSASNDLSCQACNTLALPYVGSASNASMNVHGTLNCQGSY